MSLRVWRLELIIVRRLRLLRNYSKLTHIYKHLSTQDLQFFVFFWKEHFQQSCFPNELAMWCVLFPSYQIGRSPTAGVPLGTPSSEHTYARAGVPRVAPCGRNDRAVRGQFLGCVFLPRAQARPFVCPHTTRLLLITGGEQE